MNIDYVWIPVVIAIVGLIYKAGRQSRDIESATKNITTLYKKNDSLESKLDLIRSSISDVALSVARIEGICQRSDTGATRRQGEKS